MRPIKKYVKHGQHQDIPRDDLLPGLPGMLNPEKIRSLLSHHLKDACGEIKGCDISYIRYKPATNCIILYTLQCSNELSPESSPVLLYAKVYTSAQYLEAAQKAQHHRWVDLPSIEPVLALSEYNSILYFFPNDCTIEGLRVVSSPKKIQRILYQHYNKYPGKDWRISDRQLKVSIVRYKPERRAVIRCRTRAYHRTTHQRKRIKIYIRIYGDDRGEDVFSLQQKLYQISRTTGRFTVGQPIAYLREHRVLITEALPGESLLVSLSRGQASDKLTRVAKALASLHASAISGLVEKRIESHLNEARATAAILKHTTPEVTRQVDKLLTSLNKSSSLGSSSNPGLVHGDFYYGQVLISDEEVAVIDFDRSHAGDSLVDIGNFCAHLRLLGIQGLIADSAPLEREFTTAYEKASGRRLAVDRLNFWTAFCLFKLSAEPFRRLEPEWRNKTERIVRECQKMFTET